MITEDELRRLLCEEEARDIYWPAFEVQLQITLDLNVAQHALEKHRSLGGSMRANGEGLVRLVQSFVHHRLVEKHLYRSSERFAVSGSEEVGSRESRADLEVATRNEFLIPVDLAVLVRCAVGRDSLDRAESSWIRSTRTFNFRTRGAGQHHRGHYDADHQCDSPLWCGCWDSIVLTQHSTNPPMDVAGCAGDAEGWDNDGVEWRSEVRAAGAIQESLDVPSASSSVVVNHSVIAAELTFAVDLAVDPPNKGMKEVEGLKQDLRRPDPRVAPSDMHELVHKGGLQLIVGPGLSDPVRYQNRGSPASGDNRSAQLALGYRRIGISFFRPRSVAKARENEDRRSTGRALLMRNRVALRRIQCRTPKVAIPPSQRRGSSLGSATMFPVPSIAPEYVDG